MTLGSGWLFLGLPFVFALARAVFGYVDYNLNFPDQKPLDLVGPLGYSKDYRAFGIVGCGAVGVCIGLIAA